MNDWDLDGDTDSNDPSEFSCEDGISGLSIPNLDFTGEYCIALGYVDNRSTQYDWMRMWWDLNTDQGLTLSDIQDIWSLASPDDWTAAGHGTGGDYPAQRLHEAAFDFGGSGFMTDWDNLADDEGVGR